MSGCQMTVPEGTVVVVVDEGGNEVVVVEVVVVVVAGTVVVVVAQRPCFSQPGEHLSVGRAAMDRSEIVVTTTTTTIGMRLDKPFDM